MIDLEKKSGLPIVLDDEIIIPKNNFRLPIPAFRKLDDFTAVLKEGSELTGPVIAYTMFRGVLQEENMETFEKKSLRYDITVIPAGRIGDEFIKTVGHNHPKKEGTEVTYPEIYEVIYGKAHFLFQKTSSSVIPAKAGIQDVKIIEAVAGDKVVVPADYGHVTINPGNETLVLANITESTFKSGYEDYQNKKGACFYELADGKWEKNPNYENTFEPNILNAKELNDAFDVQNGIPLYIDFIQNSEKYDFLANPEKYPEEFSRI